MPVPARAATGSFHSVDSVRPMVFPADFLPSSGWKSTKSTRSPTKLQAATLEKSKGGNMLYWAVVFLVVALVAGVLGFGGVAVMAAGMAKLLFYIFLVIFLVTLVLGLGRRRSV
jgi:uncharacterized membrane protein YtjA (UPF0391 family)